MTACEPLCNCWFRGHGSNKWKLQTTLERDAETFGVPRKNLFERENTILGLFQERAHLYIPNFKTPKSKFEWHALIRHHGGPSRLFDVSSSYLVAAYFALCDSKPKQDAEIWAFKEPIAQASAVDLDNLFATTGEPDIKIVKPGQLNARMNSQSGNFFVPGSLERPLEEQISTKFETDLKSKATNYNSVRQVEKQIHHKIWRIVIPRSAHSELFRFISRCNVRGYSLFPGLDGLAMSLREMMRAYE